MEKVIVIKENIFSENFNTVRNTEQRGASILEILLVLGIIAILSPFIYNQISETSQQIRDISIAKQVISLHDPVLNFVRVNQDKWPNIAQIKLNADELNKITDSAHAGFVDKYQVNGSIVTDVYLAFDLGGDALHTAKVVKQIGMDAASVDKDGVAYGTSWAVTAPDFKPGDLVYRVNYSFVGDDVSKYLHRSTSGKDDFNVMQRNLNMGKFNIFNIGTLAAESVKIKDLSAAFMESKNVNAGSVYFSSGANMDAGNVNIGSMRVSDDISGFRNISAKKLNDSGFSTNGNIITDKATVNNSLNIGNNLTVKSDSTKTISGFSGIIAHSIYTSFLYSDQINFYNNYGLTVSGELMMSATPPIKIGSWSFPSSTPPKFSELGLYRATIPNMPSDSDFSKILKTGWKQ
ncbi:MAG TPA: type II secretion system protein [Alphaproteobacteria bacterium]|nr:type II secretion system protein [Alphaproteobacteria bacterium]